MDVIDFENEESFTAENYMEICRLLTEISDPAERSEKTMDAIAAYVKTGIDGSIIIADMTMRGVFGQVSEKDEKFAFNSLYKSAVRGSSQARFLLDAYCKKRYEREMKKRLPEGNLEGPLVDFDGKPIKIDRTNALTPIKASLKFVAGLNILNITVKLAFLYDDFEDVSDRRKFTQAVIAGIKEWEGDYRVFNNQRLRVVVNIVRAKSPIEAVYVIPFSDVYREEVQKLANVIGTKNMKERANSVILYRRSFAFSGITWSVHSPKWISIQSDSGRFDEYDEIKHVTKHEFGHALGLGDLYMSKVDKLNGVEKGTYYELDAYHVTDKTYNLVMCDQHGPISNNDIEMVLLAFSENKGQNYQPFSFRKRISKALGNGN